MEGMQTPPPMKTPLFASLPFVLSVSLMLANWSSAQVPNLVSYQGRVAVGTTNFNGTGQLKFALVNPAGTTTYWSNNGSSTAGSQPTAAVSLTVTKGLYSVLLGDTSLANMQAIPVSVWSNADIRLRIWFNDGSNGFQLLTPDQRLAPSGYLPYGSVGNAQLASGAVLARNMAPGAGGTWQPVAGTLQAAAANTNYTATSSSLTAVTLPSSAAVGDAVQVAGAGPGGWIVPLPWTLRETNRNWTSVASSSDGNKLVAVVSGGLIYTSGDSGVTWVPRATSRNWQSVASSTDGSRLIAAASGGQIYTSADSGVTWTPHESSRNWRGVASSSDGSKLVAVVSGGQIYTSGDSGLSWTPRELGRNWLAVCSSSDGVKLAAVEAATGLVYTTANSGTTWTPHGPVGFLSASIASSADGTRLVVAQDDGTIVSSGDSGVTWTSRGGSGPWRAVASSSDGTRLAGVMRAAVGWPEFQGGGPAYSSPDSGITWIQRTDARDWSCIASSADGSKLVAAVNGGPIYTSTLPLSGGQGSMATVHYLGNGVWAPLSQTQIAAGAVGSAQLGSNLAVNGTFTGNGAGLTGLNAAQVTTGTLPSSVLDTDVARRSGGNTFAGSQLFNDGARLADKDLYLRGGSDTNHGLGWYGPGRTFGITAIDGPVLYGFNGGALGWIETQSGVFPPLTFPHVALRWDNTGSVAINGKVNVTNRLGIGVADPGAPLDISITSTRRLRVKTDTNNIPVIEAVSTDSGDGLAGYMRLRHAVEIWPKADGSAAGKLDVRDASGNPVITLDGASGESTVKVLNITGGADIAEPFHMSGDTIPKGAVVVIDELHAGQLRMSDQAYDTKVAGIVSGANGINPGLALHQQGMVEGGQNVALTGRVHALADASGESIKPGDLLTTSGTPGHLMKASDRERRDGAIVGKAMSSLESGKGFVLVLVNLQ